MGIHIWGLMDFETMRTISTQMKAWCLHTAVLRAEAVRLVSTSNDAVIGATALDSRAGILREGDSAHKSECGQAGQDVFDLHLELR